MSLRHFAIAVFILMAGVGVAQTPVVTPMSKENDNVFKENDNVFKGNDNVFKGNDNVFKGNDNATEIFTGTKRRAFEQEQEISGNTMRISLTVDDPSFLKMKIGQEIKQGDVISDNSLERQRLEKQKKSITLQIDNLKNKAIPKPFDLKQPIGVKPLPPAIFSEEQSAIAQSKMKLSQAVGLLEARTPLLKSDNPERRAEAEKAEAGLQIAAQKVEEQEQLIQSMRDMKLLPEILQHEEAKLKQLQSEMDGASSALDQAKAKLNASAINQQQELQQLQINVNLAESELEVAESRLIAAQNRRQLTEYDASLDEVRRQQQQTQTQQEYSKQQQQYAQAVRDRDYQLAQLNISLTTIEDKLAQIPMIRSPRHGYIRRIKPWVGKDGKYTTVVTITSAAPISSRNGSGDGANTTSSSKTTQR